MSEECIRARAPLRVGIAGGGTDVEPYASERGGLVFNTTIDKYAYCTIVPNSSSRMSIHSLDYGIFETDLEGGPLKYDGNMDLIKAVTNYFNVKEGFDMFIHSDAPPGSGLGGSSTVIVSVLSAMLRWQGKSMSNYDLANLAYRLEREELKLKGGKQDQYAATFGGFNFMEFGKNRVNVNPIKLREATINELQYCSLLCYTGRTRESANIIDKQVAGYASRNNENALDASKRLAVEAKDALINGKVKLLGEILDEAWVQKKLFSSSVSNIQLDKYYELAVKNGAIGGKVSGAGGGGFMFFICEYDKKHIVAKELRKQGVNITDFMFEESGVKTWRHKE